MTWRSFAGALLAALLAVAAPQSAGARHRGSSADPDAVSGRFDHYLPTLSWSPTYCLTHPDRTECDALACTHGELAELRLCMGPDLVPTHCGRGVHTSCPAGPIDIPAAR